MAAYAPIVFSSREDFQDAYKTVHATFRSNRTKDLAWRQWQLKQVWWMLADNEQRILEALKNDLNRHAFEAHTGDLYGLKSDILHTIANFREWVKDEKPGSGLINYLGKARLRKEPLGVSLIIGAWNFPFLLLLQPLLAAIASGCAAILKPSELSVHSHNLLLELVPKYLDQSAIRIVAAGPTEMGYILDHRFDQIFYTGSPNVAKIVAKAAARFLTPTVLELGGQGPAIVTRSGDIDLAAKRIAAAKFTNAGQICLSTNHAFVPMDLQPQFVERLKYWFDKFSGPGQSWGDFCKIVNDRHFDRLATLVDRSAAKIQYGGARDKKTGFMHPIIMTGVSLDDSIMSQELFGPILPIITAEPEEAVQYIRSFEHPLAIYIFSNDKEEIDYILNNTQSGGVTINDCFLHAGVDGAPFGGVGEAGQGYYHGIYGVRAFSHLRTVVGLPNWMDKLIGFRYPPYNLANLSKLGLPANPPFKRVSTWAET
ncbi:hypothetical protein BDW75DRAFT_248930 [Aspergillus navahoensis]